MIEDTKFSKRKFVPNLPSASSGRDFKTLIDYSIDALKQKDALALRRISADALSEAAIEQHREMILLSLVDYALSKILSKVHYGDLEDKFFAKIIKNFEAAKAGPKEKTIKHLETVEDLVMKLDAAEGSFSENIIDKAKIKKASKLYGQGLSLRRASEMTGANPVEVLNYVGGSKIHEFKGGGRNADRLRITREVFSE